MISNKIIAVSTYFPDEATPISAVEERILSNSLIKPPVRAVERLTGVRRVFHRLNNENASDMASKAAQKALDMAGLKPEQIDLLIFASASQDLIEPATAHIISSMLGTTCPVFDVKNACNSFLNGLQIADSLMKSGSYKTVLVVTGETPSVSIRWECNTKAHFATSFPGYSMSDSGGAVILRATTTKIPEGVISIEMSANSDLWEIGTLGTGGSRSPRELEDTYFNMNGNALFEAFKTVGCDMFYSHLDQGNIKWDEYDVIGMHQVAQVYNLMLMDTLGIPEEKTIQTIETYGNVASNSFSLQLEKAINENRLSEGQTFAFLGLGGGISSGFGVFKL